ncbi:hypothetical protein WMW72_33985 [Paenibacillus filicis]|uniref:Siphovirus-type tail component C-terminal domain-containing protein n=1 Tax=Paenibacillus filicis TaxID=669464 RepID=A0ABU9DVL5_9BACL
MFNTGSFNRIPFNRKFSANVYGSFEIINDLEVLVKGVLTVNGKFAVELENEFTMNAVRNRLASFVLENTLDMEVNGTRVTYGQFDMQILLDTQFNGSRYHEDYLEFFGEFKPGDRIVIDSELLKMTQNGQNVLHLMQGDFFDLNTGNNELTYKDDQTGRTARIRLTHRDRFV